MSPVRATGIYCFNGLPFTPRGLVGNGDANTANRHEIVQVTLQDIAECPGTEQAAVTIEEISAQTDPTTNDPNDGVPASVAFYVLFY